MRVPRSFIKSATKRHILALLSRFEPWKEIGHKPSHILGTNEQIQYDSEKKEVTLASMRNNNQCTFVFNIKKLDHKNN